MALFLSDDERAMIVAAGRHPRLSDLYWALQRRVEQRACKPGLLKGDETTDWWRPVSEYLTDAAMAFALKPDGVTGQWLRDVTLSLVRRPQADWVGPQYRNHSVLADGSQCGHLETAHICWATAIVLDLSPDVFQGRERDEVADVLRQRGVTMCLNWLDRSHSVANWWCILTAGVAVPAAVLGDEAVLARVRQELAGCVEAIEPDGSYGESLQYGNYALYAIMLASEVLRRRGQDVQAIAPLGRYIGYARWAAASYLYSRPTTGWGSAPKPRSLNFNDSAAIFKPSADLLLHLATRGRESHPVEAGLARWLFDETYRAHPAQGPDDLSSFGFHPSWGFLSLPLLPQAAAALSPAKAGLDATLAFDCGDSIARDAWGGRTVVAMRGGGPALHSVGHTHYDLNSIILVHNDQRLLTDAGHSCYRNLMHTLETSTQMHNTCVFHPAEGVTPGSMAHGSPIIEQHPHGARKMNGNAPGPVVDRGANRLIVAQCDDLRVQASEAARAYGTPIERFARFVILCGPHVVFVVDHIVSSLPVRTQWSWLLNNRDGELDVKFAGSDRIVARRGDAGMKLFSLSGGGVKSSWAHVNDAYHPLPAQRVEGRPGSGHLLQWSEPRAVTQRMVLHAIALDGYGEVARWHLRSQAQSTELEGPGGTVVWAIEPTPGRIIIRERRSDRHYELVDSGADIWMLRRLAKG